MGRVRLSNEDSYARCDQRRLYLVADGMGGHAAGKLASELSVATLMRALVSTASPGLADLRRAFRKAHRTLLERALREVELRGMGTTLSAVLIAPERRFALLGYVGDSRIYLQRRAQLRRLTLDHTLVAELVLRGCLDPGDAQRHANRNVLTRALGMQGHFEPSLAAVRIERDDRLLLCSDGVSGALSEAEIGALLHGRPGSGEAEPPDVGPGVVARALVERASAVGGDDNATALVIDL